MSDGKFWKNIRFKEIIDAQGYRYFLFRATQKNIYSKIDIDFCESIVKKYREYHSRDLKERGNVEQDPFRIYYIDPRSINKITGFEYPSSHYFVGRVIGGNWDIGKSYHNNPNPELFRAEEFNKLPIHLCIKKHFEQNISWGQTEFIQSIISFVEDGNSWHGCRNRSDILNRCKYIDRLYKKIKVEGYKTNREIKQDQNNDILKTYVDEIMVDQARDKSYQFSDGAHRLSIAKVLGLEKVPVVIRIRHPKSISNE